MSRPNFFVGIRIQSESLAAAVKKIQDHVLQQDSSLNKCRMNTDKLHLTCFVATLHSEEEKNLACLILQSFQNDLGNMCNSASWELSFREIHNFTTKVLYCAPEASETLELLREIKEILETRFRDSGINGLPPAASKDAWTPHCTILKTSYDRRNGRKLKISPELYSDCEKMLHQTHTIALPSAPDSNGALDSNSLIDSTTRMVDFAEESVRGVTVPLTTIDLLSMREVQADGYYRSYAHISF